MRRQYAFEAENLTDNVRSQLERVEDAVDAKCTSASACESMLNRIEAEEKKFNGALESMIASAKNAQRGAIDRATMASQIAPVAAELKGIAGEIGVATESAGVSQDELNDVRAYISGAKEIVESKYDELSRATEAEEAKDDEKKSDDKGDEPKDDDKGDEKKDDKGDEPKDDKKKDDDEKKGDDEEPEEGDADEEAATESLVLDGVRYPLSSIALESTLDAMIDLDLIAMEGYNWNEKEKYAANIDKAKASLKSAKASAKIKDYQKALTEIDAGIKAAEASLADFKEAQKANQDGLNAVCGYFASGWRMIGHSFLVTFATLGIGAGLAEVRRVVDIIDTLVTGVIKAAKGEATASDFNVYTHSLERNMQLMIARMKSARNSYAAAAKRQAEHGGDKANESFSDASIEGFVAACESVMIEQKKAPYLFD